MSSEQKTTSHLVYTKLECPFDLESVLKITYSTDGLKQVLEFILDHLGEVKMVSGENAKLGS
jgi:phenylalanine-4-hydroxylase